MSIVGNPRTRGLLRQRPAMLLSSRPRRSGGAWGQSLETPPRCAALAHHCWLSTTLRMPAPTHPMECPFCGSPVSARVRVCGHCKAERRRAPGMTPLRFQLFVALWCVLSVPLMAFAFYLAALPWTRTGTPPGYALSLVGASGAQVQARCRVVVFDSRGQRSERLSDAPCGAANSGATAAPAATQPTPPPQSTLRLASALHSTVALAGGALACWLLMAPLRLLLRRRAASSWVRRVAA